MKKRIILLIIFIMLFIPNMVSADEYNTVKLNAVFTTSADVSSIGKIYVQLTTYTEDAAKSNDVYLLKEKNFQANITLDKPVIDAKMVYGYCITVDGIADKYGFLPIKSTALYSEGVITINIKVSFNPMDYDGTKYRKNSDLTPDELIRRKQGLQDSDQVVGGTTTSSSNNKPTTTTKEGVTSPDGKIIIGAPDETTTESTTTIIYDNKEDNKPTKETKISEKSTNILIIILVAIGLFVLIFIIVTIIKMNQANKMV